MPTANITFGCGEKTCYKKAGKPCRFVKASHFGTRWYCGLFDNQELKDSNGIPSGEGWLQRLPECMKLS